MNQFLSTRIATTKKRNSNHLEPQSESGTGKIWFTDPMPDTEQLIQNSKNNKSKQSILYELSEENFSLNISTLKILIVVLLYLKFVTKI